MAKLSLLDLLAVQREQDKNLYQAKIGDIADLVEGSSVIISPDPPYYFDAYGNEFGDRPVDGQLWYDSCLLYTSPSPRDRQKSRMPSSA